MANREKLEALEQGETESAPEQEGGKGKHPPKLLIIILLAIVLAGGGFFGFKIMKGGLPARTEPKVGEVVTLEEFLVNLSDGTTFLRVNIALGIIEGVHLGKDDGHGGGGGADTPPIRDAIIMILTAKRPQDIDTVNGKENLKAEIALQLNKILGDHKPEDAGKSTDIHTDSPEKNDSGNHKKSEETNAGPVLEVYFTSFATQKY